MAVVRGVVDLVLHPRRAALDEQVVGRVGTAERAVAVLDGVVELVGRGCVERALRRAGEAGVVAVEDHARRQGVDVVPRRVGVVPDAAGMGAAAGDVPVEPSCEHVDTHVVAVAGRRVARLDRGCGPAEARHLRRPAGLEGLQVVVDRKPSADRAVVDREVGAGRRVRQGRGGGAAGGAGARAGPGVGRGGLRTGRRLPECCLDLVACWSWRHGEQVFLQLLEVACPVPRHVAAVLRREAPRIAESLCQVKVGLCLVDGSAGDGRVQQLGRRERRGDLRRGWCRAHASQQPGDDDDHGPQTTHSNLLSSPASAPRDVPSWSDPQ